MKLFKRFSCVVAAFCALWAGLTLSCDMAGMGPIIDLEPPTVIIRSPARFSYVPGEFTLSGTWMDNIKVTRIVVSNIGSGVEYGSANIAGNGWSLTINVDEDGQHGFKATVYDAGGNAGADTVTVFVDKTPPVVSKVELVRHPGLVPLALKPLDDLKARDPAEYAGMDYFQNESITIRAQIDENRGIRAGGIRLKLSAYDEPTNSLIPLEITLTSDSPNPLAPAWILTQALLAPALSGAAIPVPASGIYYLKMAVEVFDEANNTNQDNSPGFFAWGAETDKPRIIPAQESAGKITVNESDPVVFEVLDDDDLGLVYAKILSAAEWAAVSGADNAAKLEGLLNAAKGGVSTILGSSRIETGNYRKRTESIPLAASAVPGKYRLVVLAADRKEGSTPPAGSVWSARSIELTVNDTSVAPEFPLIQSITCANPNGAYRDGDTLTFMISFEDKVTLKPAAQANAKITISGTGAGDTVNKVVGLEWPQPSPTAGLKFSYAVQAGENLRNIQVNAIDLTGLVYGSGANEKTYDNSSFSARSLSRPGLIVDARPPAIDTYVPAPDGIMADRETITLTFSEPVFAETGGLLQIRPYGDWYVPPVLSEDEFRSLSQSTALTEAQKRVLNYVDGTGRPLGYPITVGNRQNYYTKNTQGLNLSGTYAVPDRDTKYVLDFAIGLTGTEVAPLREALNAAKWKWQDIDAAGGDVEITGATVTITLPRELERGRQWELRIPANSFRDAAGNTAAPLGWGAYQFWSPETEAPVIRVNRTSYNGGNPLSVSQSRPAVDVPVRIDCETPGAVITYHRWSKTPNSANNTGSDFWTSTTRENKVVDNAQRDEFTAISSSTGMFIPYTGLFYAGDKNGVTVSAAAADVATDTDASLFRARKDYVAAVAIRSGHGQSEVGYEGVFKTVIMFRTPNMETASDPLQRLRLSGENHTLAGFPFLQLSRYDNDYGKDMYRISAGGSIYNFLWLSWEIVDDWDHIKSYGYNSSGISDVIDERVYNQFISGYGMVVYRHAVTFW